IAGTTDPVRRFRALATAVDLGSTARQAASLLACSPSGSQPLSGPAHRLAQTSRTELSRWKCSPLSWAKAQQKAEGIFSAPRLNLVYDVVCRLGNSPLPPWQSGRCGYWYANRDPPPAGTRE